MKLEEALHRVEREGRRLKEDLAEANERLYAMNGRDDGDNSGVADAEKELSKLKSKIKAQEETNGHLLKAGKELKSSLETARRLHTELESRSKDADMRQVRVSHTHRSRSCICSYVFALMPLYLPDFFFAILTWASR